MNLELLDPFRRQIPDRVDSALSLPGTITNNLYQQQQQNVKSKSKSATTAGSTTAEHHGASIVTSPTTYNVGENDDESVSRGSIMSGSVTGASITTANASSKHLHSSPPPTTIPTTEDDAVDGPNANAITTGDDDWKAAYHVSFNRRGEYLAVGHANGIVAVHDFLSRTISALYGISPSYDPSPMETAAATAVAPADTETLTTGGKSSKKAIASKKGTAVSGTSTPKSSRTTSPTGATSGDVAAIVGNDSSVKSQSKEKKCFTIATGAKALPTTTTSKDTSTSATMPAPATPKTQQQQTKQYPPLTFPNGVTSVTWSRRSRTLLAGAVGDPTVRLFDTTHPLGPFECCPTTATSSTTTATTGLDSTAADGTVTPTTPIPNSGVEGSSTTAGGLVDGSNDILIVQPAGSRNTVAPSKDSKSSPFKKTFFKSTSSASTPAPLDNHNHYQTQTKYYYEMSRKPRRLEVKEITTEEDELVNEDLIAATRESIMKERHEAALRRMKQMEDKKKRNQQQKSKPFGIGIAGGSTGGVGGGSHISSGTTTPLGVALKNKDGSSATSSSCTSPFGGGDKASKYSSNSNNNTKDSMILTLPTKKISTSTNTTTTTTMKRYASLVWTFQEPVGGSLQVHPRETASGLAVLKSGKLILFSAPTTAWEEIQQVQKTTITTTTITTTTAYGKVEEKKDISTKTETNPTTTMNTTSSTFGSGSGGGMTSPPQQQEFVKIMTIWDRDEIISAAFDSYGDKVYAATRNGKLIGLDIKELIQRLLVPNKNSVVIASAAMRMAAMVPGSTTTTTTPKTAPKTTPKTAEKKEGATAGAGATTNAKKKKEILAQKIFEISIPGGSQAWHLQVSRNGKLVLLNCSDGALRLYQTENCWKQKQPQKGDDNINVNGYEGDDDSNMRRIKPTFVFQDIVSKAPFVSCDFSGDGEYVVGGCNGIDDKYELYLWNTTTGALMDRLTGAQVSLYSVTWHPTRSFLAVATSDGLVDIWGPRMDWTAFAPDFQALPMNVEYVEHEEEFDIVDSTTNKQEEVVVDEEDKGHDNIAMSDDDGGGDSNTNIVTMDENDDEFVDVLTIDPVPVFQSDSENEEEVFHYGTKIKNIMAGRGRNAMGWQGKSVAKDDE